MLTSARRDESSTNRLADPWARVEARIPVRAVRRIPDRLRNSRVRPLRSRPQSALSHFSRTIPPVRMDSPGSRADVSLRQAVREEDEGHRRAFRPVDGVGWMPPS